MSDFTSQVRSVITQFRKACLAGCQDLDTVLPKERQERFGGEARSTIVDFMVGPRKWDALDHIVGLIQTPRVLKLVLRHFDHFWTRLHGEIDCDDLLMAMTLRYASTEAYDFLLRHTAEIRYLERESVAEDAKERLAALNRAWKQLAEHVDWDEAAARGIIGYLFPMWSCTHSSRPRFPQGVWNPTPTDYWERLNRGTLLHDEVHDQETLRALRGWKEDHAAPAFRGDSLARALVARNDLADKVEQFGKRELNAADVRSLASMVFAEILDHYGNTACRDSAEAFIVLWRLSLEKPFPSVEHVRWVLRELEHAMPRSLHFANDIFYFWRHGDRREIGVGSEQPTPEVFRGMLETLRGCFAQRPAGLLCSALDPSFPWVVSHLARLHAGKEYSGKEFDVAEWSWFFLKLLDGAKREPVVVSHLVTCFFHRNPDPMVSEGKRYSVDWELAEQIFGTRLSEFVELVSRGFDVSVIRADMREDRRLLMEYAKTEAQNWLNRKKSRRNSP